MSDEDKLLLALFWWYEAFPAALNAAHVGLAPERLTAVLCAWADDGLYRYADDPLAGTLTEAGFQRALALHRDVQWPAALAPAS